MDVVCLRERELLLLGTHGILCTLAVFSSTNLLTLATAVHILYTTFAIDSANRNL